MLRTVNTVRANISKRVLVLLVLLGALVLGFSVSGVLADTEIWPTRGDEETINGCVNYKTGVLRIVKKANECSWVEVKVQLASADAVQALTDQVIDLEDENATQNTRIDDLETTTTALQTDLAALALQVPDCLSEVSGNAVFSGCDVHVNNGEGSTDTKDGTGNLIVGYNENSQTFDRTGSHNIIVGSDLGYSSYGGLVVGFRNQITGTYSSVSGGWGNEASGIRSSVSGGNTNIANGFTSSVSGGGANKASGFESSVSGGDNNEASGPRSSVSGGEDNEARGTWSSVSGGEGNIASGQYSSVSGGLNNTASGVQTSVSGGQNNEASGPRSSVSGGGGNQASGTFSSVSGGDGNTASGSGSSISGGTINTASGGWSSVSGGFGCTLLSLDEWGAKQGNGTAVGDC